MWVDKNPGDSEQVYMIYCGRGHEQPERTPSSLNADAL